MNYKTCKQCGWKKPTTEFYPKFDGTPKWRCIDCDWKIAKKSRPSFSGIRR